MDSKYQDLHIYNWKNHGTSVMREIKIEQIIFTDTELTINFVKGGTEMKLVLPKKYTLITVD